VSVSDVRLKRRRFLADLLFVGGGLGATALAARWLQAAPKAPPEPPPPVAAPATPARPPWWKFEWLQAVL
jgi:hypothetical protein